MPQGTHEFKTFLNGYTQASFHDGNGVRTAISRSTYVTTLLSYTKGWKPRWNWGVDAILRSVYAPASGSSQKLYRLQDPSTRISLAFLGPKLKYRLTEKIAIQSMLLFPTGKDMDGSQSSQAFLDYDRLLWWSSAYLNQPIGDHWGGFIQLDVVARLGRDLHGGLAFADLPFKAILSRYQGRWTWYASSEVSVRVNPQASGSGYAQLGLGAKRLLGASFEVEALWTSFPWGINAGAGQTANVGVRKTLF